MDYLPEVYRNYTLFQVNSFNIHYHQVVGIQKLQVLLRVDMDSLIKTPKILIHIKIMQKILLKIQQNKIMFHSYNSNKMKKDKPKETTEIHNLCVFGIFI